MAATTAVSTLVLALEARNNTAGAFSELRGQLREQVSAAQQAARQTAEAARTAQEEQLRALRQTTAQEQLELRQRTAYEAQQIRAAAAGQGTAARQAAQDQILTKRQDAEQQALVMRQSADNQAASIRSTTDAQIRASREQLEAVETTARREAEAMRLSQGEQAAAAREAAAQERAAAREGGGRRGVLGLGLPGMPGVGLLGSLGQMAWWNIGYGAITQVTDAVGGFLKGLVTTNAELEQLRQTFTAVYGSAAAGQAAVRWLDDFAQKVPATREEVMQAGLTIATLGDNVGQVLPALSNVAAVMGVDLPKAAQAFADAQMGRWEMMQMDLHITKAELVKFGLQVDSTGHVLNNSLVPAFLRLARSPEFVHGAALQMDTFSGKMSNVADALTRLQEIAGHGIFTVLKGELDGLIKILQSTDAQRWAAAVGDALGHMLQAAMHAASWMATQLAPVVRGVVSAMVAAWDALAPLAAPAIRAFEGMMEGIGTFLQHDVLPVVQNAIGQIATWWNDHSKDLGKVWDDLTTGATKFWTWLGGTMQHVMMELQGYWTIAWGVMSGVVGVVIDIVSGDWTRAKADLLNIWKAIEVGVLQIANGLIDQLIHAFQLLAGPIATVLNAIFVPTFKAIVDVGVELFTFLVLKIEQGFGTMVGNVGASVAKLATKWGPLLNLLPIPGGHAIAAALYGAAAVSGGAGGLTDKDIAQRVQAAGQGAAAAAGGFVGPHPIPTVTFDDKKATAAVDAWFAGAEKGIHYGPKGGFEAGGKKWWDSFMDAVHKHAPGKPTMPKWLQDLLGGIGGPLPPPGAAPGAGGSGDLRSLTEAQQKAIKDAENSFQIDLMSGHLTQAQGLRDISAILAAQRAAGASRDELTLTALQDTKTLMEQLLSQAQKQFDFDSNVAHPSRQKLHQDELAYLQVLAQEPGITPLDLATARQQMDARVAQLTGQGTKDVLGQLQKQFDFDAGVAHPSIKKLHQDELAYLAAYAATPGVTRLDVALARQEMEKRIAALAGTATKPKDIVADDINRFKTDLLTLGRSTQEHARLVADVNRIKRDEVAAHDRGAKVAYDFAENMKKVNEHMKVATAARGPIAPVPRYGALAGETGYGQTVVSFGGAQANPWQSMVAALREQITHLRAQLAKDDQLIALLEVGNATGSQQLGVLRSIDGHVIPGPPTPARSAHSALKAAGSYAPVTR